MHTIQRHCK